MTTHKHLSILYILDRLQAFIGENSIETVDYWEADLYAVGLKKGQRLVYISTFNHIHQTEMRYDYDIETFGDDKTDTPIHCRKIRNAKESQFIEDIIITFGDGYHATNPQL